MADIWDNGHDYDSHTVDDPRDEQIARLRAESEAARKCHAVYETDTQAMIAELRAEVERLTKMLDVCSATHGHNVRLKADVDRVTRERNDALAALRDVEWGGPERHVTILDPHGPVTHTVRLCPKCGHPQPHEILASQRWKANYAFGHSPNCTLARLLKGGG